MDRRSRLSLHPPPTFSRNVSVALTKPKTRRTRMHSSRMRTARSSSRLLCVCGEVFLLQCMLGYTPPRCGPGDPPGCGPEDPPGVGLETPLAVDLKTPQVWAWRPPWPDSSSSPLGVGLETPPKLDPSSSPLVVGLETCKAC